MIWPNAWAALPHPLGRFTLLAGAPAPAAWKYPQCPNPGPCHPVAHDPNLDFSHGAAELRERERHPPEYVEYLDRAASGLKTVRLIVYAGMTSFVILAFYGFFLIFRLTGDLHAAVVQTQIMTQQMQAMTLTMANMNQSISAMHDDVTAIRTGVVQMETSVARMADAVTLMQHSARNIDQSVGPMLGTLNSFMPFGWPGGSYEGAPPPAP